MSFGKTETLDKDRIYEGLRIPPLLSTVQSVNFVLTQEPGKLKPKDLKVAIERNRAEKEQRAEEQKKIRDQGGGAGMLDLRGILSEERLNASQGDPFKRQLREMAFLADVEDVEKLEIEKGFRVSEDYLGSLKLTKDEIDLIYKQRQKAILHKKRSDWRNIQFRNLTNTYNSSHILIKAGTSADTSKVILSTISPHFDPNRNDLWAKRLNTLRKFISSVSKWLIRNRVKQRMDSVMSYFHTNNCFTRDEIRSFIENSIPSQLLVEKKRPATTQGNNSSSSTVLDEPTSVSVIIFANANPQLINREKNKKIMDAVSSKIHAGESEVSANMVRRILFPRCDPPQGGDSGDVLEPLAVVNIQTPICFDDRTFYQLKVKPDYLTLGYQTIPIPMVPLHFPEIFDKTQRLGAPEELLIRPSADDKVNDSDILTWMSKEDQSIEPKVLETMRIPNRTIVNNSSTTDNKLENKINNKDEGVTTAANMPQWLTHSEDMWTSNDLNFIDDHSLYRVYGAAAIGPRRCELDSDWILRPDSELLVYEQDSSIRSRWCSIPGFNSVNYYLLGSQESRNRDPPPSLPGPTLADYYLPDNDRHMSGLSCFGTTDHLRSATQWDHDISGLQERLDKNDYLTDSESDNEDVYGTIKPSIQRVRVLLNPPPPKVEEPVITGKGGGKAPAKGKEAPKTTVPVAAVLVTPAVDTSLDDFSILLGEGQRKEEQVELMSDRKILDLESIILRNRRNKIDEFTKRLCEISKQSKCLVQALPVQMPFHSYEDAVYKLIEPRIPALKTQHVEMNVNQSTDSLLGAGTTFSQLLSPTSIHA